MGILPGGTGNGFACEIGIPKDLREAAELLCTSENVRNVDAARVGDEYFIQRLYAGVPPESQTSRDLTGKISGRPREGQVGGSRNSKCSRTHGSQAV